MSGISESDSSIIAAVVAQHKDRPGALLPILHGVQSKLGYIPVEAVAVIAKALQQTSAEITGVISFYHHFRSSPPARNQLQICRAEACQARGSRALEQHVQERLNIGYHQTTIDREYSLEPVYCLGNCACGPSLRINDDVVGRVTPQQFDQLLDELATLPLEVS